MLTYGIILIGIPLIVAIWAQASVSSAFGKWKQIPASSGLTGAQTAQQILNAANIRDVQIAEVQDMLGDHYDPSSKRLCLSPEVYEGRSVASVGIAAHEVGHAIQHANGYVPLQWRMAIVPATQIASRILPFIFIGSFFFERFGLITLAIVCYLVLTVFQLITLPVEYDASRRAKIILGRMQIIQPGAETAGVNNVLDAAALTYVAAFIGSLGNLAYFFLARQEER